MGKSAGIDDSGSMQNGLIKGKIILLYIFICFNIKLRSLVLPRKIYPGEKYFLRIFAKYFVSYQ